MEQINFALNMLKKITFSWVQLPQNAASQGSEECKIRLGANETQFHVTVLMLRLHKDLSRYPTRVVTVRGSSIFRYGRDFDNISVYDGMEQIRSRQWRCFCMLLSER